MLFFDFLIALVARGWYFFMRKGLRRKPALVWLTILTLLVEIALYSLINIYLFNQDGLLGLLLAIPITAYIMILMLLASVAYLYQVTIACNATYDINRALFIANVILITISIFGILYSKNSEISALLCISLLVRCVIYVGNMLPDEPPKRKKEKKVAVGTELPDPGSAS